MKKQNILHHASYAIALSSVLAIAHHVRAEEAMTLDEINVSAEADKSNKKEEVFFKSRAVSVRDNLQQNTQSLDNVLRSVPGAFTQADKSQGAISPNIRGMSGLGRVNTMIDGVTQTFYGTSTDSGERGSGTSQFGALIDPSFLTSADIERGTFSGRGGANSLMGAVNLRTLDVNDIVQKGNQVGGSFKMLGGTNASGPHYSAVLGAKKAFDEEHYLGILYGYSWRKISQDYKIGGGKRVTENLIDRCSYDVCTQYDDPDDEINFSQKPYNPEHLLQRPRSHLVKLEYGDRKQNAKFSYRTFNNFVAGRKIKNDNYQFDYHVKLLDNPWLNMNVLYNDNRASQTYFTGAKFSGKAITADLKAKNKSTTLDLNNTIEKEFSSGLYAKATFGINRLKNNYGKNRHPFELNVNFDEDEGDKEGDIHCNTYDGLTCLIKGLTNSSFQPEGEQRLNTFYLDTELSYNIFTLNLNANLLKHRFTGQYAENMSLYVDQLNDQLSGLSETAPQYQQKLAEFKTLGQQYCSPPDDDEDPKDYPYGFDPQNCRDTNRFYNASGSHRKVNYSAGLSVNLHDLFTPFVTYSNTYRVPNIREMFFSNFGKYGINPNLAPEQAKTLQFGFNSFKEGLFTDDDKFGFKLTFYRSKIKDYIYNVLYTSPPTNDFRGLPLPDILTILDRAVIRHENYRPNVINKGVELELNYDMGRAYANFAFAYQKSNAPVSYTDYNERVDVDVSFYHNSLGYGLSKLAFLPKMYATLDVGTRWFDNKLVIGSVAHYYGKSRRADSKTEYISIKNNRGSYTQIGLTRKASELPKQPMIFDFYVTYEPIQNLTLRLDLQNAFDKKYIDPLDSNNDSASQHIEYISNRGFEEFDVMNNFSRGRTWLFSLNYKF